MKKLVCTSALLLAMSGAHAVDSIRWDSATFAYQTIDLEDSDVELSGVVLAATKKLNENVFAAVEYSTASDEETGVLGIKTKAELDTFALGLGYRTPLSNKTDMYGLVSYVDYEASSSIPNTPFGRDEEDNGLSFKAGVRSLISPNVELSGALNHVKIDDESESGFDVSAMYHLNDQFSAGVGYASSGDTDGMNVSMSVFF